jgi:chorismate dehydratase
MTEPLRVGRVGFLNTFPVEWALTRHLHPALGVEITGVPTSLNAMLVAGDVDIANVSSIEYARHSEQYVLLPSLCVGSDGAVDSVQLISELPLEDVRSVAATSQSASSVALVRTLLPQVEIRPETADADARLLIGNDALHSAFHDPTPHHDLGELWRNRTGLPMVFAVWAAQRDLDPELLLRVDRALAAAVEDARTHAADVARAASERYAYPPGFLARYFERLRYRFGRREREGLARFFSLAHERGVLPSAPELRFAGAEVTR